MKKIIFFLSIGLLAQASYSQYEQSNDTIYKKIIVYIRAPSNLAAHTIELLNTNGMTADTVVVDEQRDFPLGVFFKKSTREVFIYEANNKRIDTSVVQLGVIAEYRPNFAILILVVITLLMSWSSVNSLSKSEKFLKKYYLWSTVGDFLSILAFWIIFAVIACAIYIYPNPLFDTFTLTSNLIGGVIVVSLCWFLPILDISIKRIKKLKRKTSETQGSLIDG